MENVKFYTCSSMIISGKTDSKNNETIRKNLDNLKMSYMKGYTR